MCKYKFILLRSLHRTNWPGYRLACFNTAQDKTLPGETRKTTKKHGVPYYLNKSLPTNVCTTTITPRWDLFTKHHHTMTPMYLLTGSWPACCHGHVLFSACFYNTQSSLHGHEPMVYQCENIPTAYYLRILMPQLWRQDQDIEIMGLHGRLLSLNNSCYRENTALKLLVHNYVCM